MKLQIFFLLSFINVMCAMERNNLTRDQIEQTLREPIFVQVRLSSTHQNELVITRITSQSHPTLCARMRQSQEAFPGFYMIIKPDAIDTFCRSSFLAALRQMYPAQRDLVFTAIMQNQNQQE